MKPLPKIDRRSWLALWAQGRRRKRQHQLLPVPVLRAQFPEKLAWDWTNQDPFKWLIWMSLNGGASWTQLTDYWTLGSARLFAPDGGGELYYIVGVDAGGNEITGHSNVIRPDDALYPAPVLTAASPGKATWTWAYLNPTSWKAYASADAGATYQFEASVPGDYRQYTPADITKLVYIVGVNASNVEISEHSNAVRPADGAAVPLSIPGLKLWVRASSLVGMPNSDPVDAWADDSGNNNELDQATGASQPLFQAAGAGPAAVVFDGTDDMMATPGNVLWTEAHTIFAVVRPTSVGECDLVATPTTGTNGDFLFMLYANRIRAHFWTDAEADNLIMVDGDTVLDPDNLMLFEQELNSTRLEVRLNGALDGYTNLDGATGGATRALRLGSRGGSAYLNGEVCALLVYDRVLSSVETDRLRTYLAATYGLSLNSLS